MKAHRSALAWPLVLAIVAGLAPTASAADSPDLANLAARAARLRATYLEADRLTDEELVRVIDSGYAFTPGQPLPHWTGRFVAWLKMRERAEKLVGPPAEATAGPNVNLSALPQDVQSESFFAIDRTNPDRVLAASNWLSGSNQAIYWSGDAGATWSRVLQPLGNADFHSDPGVAFDTRGNAYAVALGIVVSANQAEIQVSRSSDGGRTWSPGSVAHSNSANDKELMAVDHTVGSRCQDTVCAIWDVTGASINTACSPTGAAPWIVRTVASGNYIGSHLSFGPDGTLYAAFANRGAGRDIQVSRSDDCGLTWSAPARIAATAESYDFGVPAMCVRRVLLYPAIDLDRSNGPGRGSVHVAWGDTPGIVCNNCAGCNANVYYARSTDGGRTWSAPVTVHSEPPGSDQFNHWLAVNDTDGSVNVMWYDTRDDPNRRQAHVYFRQSLDGGQTWEPELRVTTQPTDETGPGADPNGNQWGDYNGLDAFGCRAYPVWTDRRDPPGGGEQIYTAEVSSCCTGTAPPDLGNTLRAVSDPLRQPAVSWADLGGPELDYKVYRGTLKDFATNPPTWLGTSGGPDAVAWTDTTVPATPGVWYYKVRGLGDCGAEISTW